MPPSCSAYFASRSTRECAISNHSAFVVRVVLTSWNLKPVLAPPRAPANVWLRTSICAWTWLCGTLPSASVGPLLITWK